MTAPSKRSLIRSRALAVAVIAGATVLASSATVAVATQPAAAAVDATGWWYSAMGIADAHAAGWTGDGVKIAVLDAQINPEAPGIAGVQLTVDERFTCGGEPGKTTHPTTAALHGTGMVQTLAASFGFDGDIGGIAPDADITFYALGASECRAAMTSVDKGALVGSAIVAAVDDGNEVISMSFGGSSDASEYAAIAYALAHDVVVVSSSPNFVADQTPFRFPVGANGVVSVAAVSDSMDLLFDEAASSFVVTPEIVVVAPGVNTGTVGTTSGWSELGVANGSSTSAQLVAGALALAMQKFPGATGSQLIHALINTTASAQAGLGRDTVHGYGYGLVSLSGLLGSDPLSYPDVNPLMDKSSGKPSVADVAEAGGASSSPAPQASETPSSPKPKPTDNTEAVDGDSVTSEGSEPGGDMMPWLVGGGAVAVLLIGVIVVLVAKSRRAAGQSRGL